MCEGLNLVLLLCLVNLQKAFKILFSFIVAWEREKNENEEDA